MLCPGKPVMEAGKPDNSNAYSREGTAAHQVLEWCLLETKQAAAFAGRVIEVEGDKIAVDDDMVEHVQWAIDQVYDYAAGSAVMAETRVNYADSIGVNQADGWGTADVIIPRDDELIVMDLKYGRGVEVIAERNPQMMLYGLGALGQCDGIMGDFKRVRLVVLQPRVSRSPSEWDCSVEELRQWAAGDAWNAVERRQLAVEFKHAMPGEPEMWAAEYLRPNEKSCKFCKAKATCPALRDTVAQAVFTETPAALEDFEVVTPSLPTPTASAHWLAACLSKVDLIEDWCKAIRAETERRLLAGEDVPGYKVVQGKRGNRAWSDPKAAEELLKSMRLKQEQLYDFTVKSPTQIAKLGPKLTREGKIAPVKPGDPPPVIGPRQWPKVAAMITQSDGRPHVAPVSDPRPALDVRPASEDFENLADDLA